MVSKPKPVREVLSKRGVRLRNAKSEIRTTDNKWKKVTLNTLVYHRGKNRWSVWTRRKKRKR